MVLLLGGHGIPFLTCLPWVYGLLGRMANGVSGQRFLLTQASIAFRFRDPDGIGADRKCMSRLGLPDCLQAMI